MLLPRDQHPTTDYVETSCIRDISDCLLHPAKKKAKKKKKLIISFQLLISQELKQIKELREAHFCN